VPVGLQLLLIWRTLFIVISVKFSHKMVEASLLYNNGGSGFVYEKKTDPCNLKCTAYSRPPTPRLLYLPKSNNLYVRKIFFTFAEIVSFLLLAFIKGKELGL
jgi:hypothetical protein